jgi:hypothetical protein
LTLPNNQAGNSSSGRDVEKEYLLSRIEHSLQTYSEVFEAAKEDQQRVFDRYLLNVRELRNTVMGGASSDYWFSTSSSLSILCKCWSVNLSAMCIKRWNFMASSLALYLKYDLLEIFIPQSCKYAKASLGNILMVIVSTTPLSVSLSMLNMALTMHYLSAI